MPTIGETLQESRKKKGVSQETAARALKIKIDRLRDLEEGRYDQFAAHVYVRSFLRHYAEYLGLDSNALVQQFLDENPAPPIKPVFEITEEQRSRSPVQRHVPSPSTSFFLTTTGKTVILTALLILILVGTCMWWIINNMDTTQPTPPAEAPKPRPPVEAVEPSGNSFGIPSSPASGTNAPPAEPHHGQ